MSVWTTKALDRDRNYIVLKHPLKGVNYNTHGVKFRGGFAVVEKGSKTYNMLKKMPILKNAVELPLTFLKQCSFITRLIDIKIIYGQDVYRLFLRELEAEQKQAAVEEQNQKETDHLQLGGCSYRHSSGTMCSREALKNSPSQYCYSHILDDTKLVEIGISVPKFIAKDEKDKLRSRITKQLEKVKRGEDGQIIGNEQKAE